MKYFPTTLPRPCEGMDFILIGGFLGAGKTTAMLALASFLKDRGLKIGLITNDQSDGLVDTVLAEKAGLGAVRQVAGGCFCCRSDTLVEALTELHLAERPDVLLAEPVGSCTDLVATVLLPLDRVYNLGLRIAPLSVLLDARRLWAHYFGNDIVVGFSKDVRYIYLKQMEEAEILVINKSDLLGVRERNLLEGRLRRDFQGKRLFFVSARNGDGMCEWFAELLDADSETEKLMEVDYDRYGVGEALLGWVNATLILRAEARFDGDALVQRITNGIADKLAAEKIEVAHLKVSLADSDSTQVGVVQLVQTNGSPELTRQLKRQIRSGQMFVNLRAEGSPERLDEVVKKTAASELAGFEVYWEKTSAFRPGQPTPTHRITALNLPTPLPKEP